MSIDKFLGCDVGLPKVSTFTEELLKEKIDAGFAFECIKNYSLLYHKCAEHVMNGDLDKAEEIREALRNGDTI